MAKFGQAGKTGGQLNALQRLATAELPTGTPVQEEQVAPQAPAPQVQPTPAAAPVQEAVQAGLDPVLQEEQRQSIPNLRQRAGKLGPVERATESNKADGGIFNRAKKMADSVRTGSIKPVVSLANTPGFIPAREGKSGQEVADAIAEEKEGSLMAAVNRAGAVVNTDPRNPEFDPDYIMAASMVTENTMMELARGDKDIVEGEADPIALALQEEAPPPDFGPKKKIKQIAKAQNNAALGQQIHQEYQRLKGVTTPEKLPQKEAETVGDVFKELWAADNPGLVRRIRDPNNQQVYFELTPVGEDVLASGQQTRKTLFPSKNVKPSKIPLEKGRLLGDVGQQVKNVQGAVGKQDFSKVINDAMSNLAQVPNVVNKNRLKVLYSTVLPVMQGLQQDPQTALTSWEAEINNIGESKMAKYNAAEAQALADPENNAPYNAMEELSLIHISEPTRPY